MGRFAANTANSLSQKNMITNDEWGARKEKKYFVEI
jgi:hypothetical protein